MIQEKTFIMRSAASIKSHPIHPILITFPIAFFIGTLVLDVLFYIQDEEKYRNLAVMLSLAGIGSGLLAAVPGLIDFIFTVPPESSAKKRAAKHGVLNATVIVLFIIALSVRDDSNRNEFIVLGLEVVAVILLFISGWLGGTLVYRNQIGVDPRYANAGKWKEKYFTKGMTRLEVCASDELEVDQMKLIHIGKKRIAIARTKEGYRAFDDRCPHRGGSLAGGAMICGTVQCPWHGSQFNANDGKVVAGPATDKIQTYPLTESNGKVYLDLSN